MKKPYKAVLFDLGGTVRICHTDETWQNDAKRKMAELAGTHLDSNEFFNLVEERYEPYRLWALRENREAGDEELWTKWLLPDGDPERIRKTCHELTFQYRQTKGLRTVVDHGAEVIRELKRRGYKLGIVSNLIGETEVPAWLEADGLSPYFDSVVLSSVCHIRKPDPEIYRIAVEELGVTPEECVSVADNLSRDITGARACNIGWCVLFRSPEKKHPVEINDVNRPDQVIDSFLELLELLAPLDEGGSSL